MTSRNTSLHTAGPWRIINDKTIVGADHGRQGFIADVNLHRNNDDGETDGEANAAFIVRACNAHDDLVAALRKAKAALYNVPEVGKKYDQQHSHTHSQACLDIDVAIANAEGRPA